MSATFLFPDKTNFTPDMSETARYLGYRRTTPPQAEVSALMEKAAGEMQAVMKAQAVFEIFDLHIDLPAYTDCPVKPDNDANGKSANDSKSTRGNGTNGNTANDTDHSVTFGQLSQTLAPEVSFADVTLHSRDLSRNLAGCTKVALLAATIGPQVDALIRRHSSLDPVYASILQATGAMFIEELVDLVNEEIKKIAAAEGLKTKPRYSPGFGDVPLQVQKDFFRLLPCTRIGLTLMDTLIMAPEKSVTAFVGIY